MASYKQNWWGCLIQMKMVLKDTKRQNQNVTWVVSVRLTSLMICRRTFYSGHFFSKLEASSLAHIRPQYGLVQKVCCHRQTHWRTQRIERPYRCQDRCPSKKESEDEISRADLSPHTSYPGCYEVDWASCKCLPHSPFTNAWTSCSRKMTRISGRYINTLPRQSAPKLC